jgi:hypothetical protein
VNSWRVYEEKLQEWTAKNIPLATDPEKLIAAITAGKSIGAEFILTGAPATFVDRNRYLTKLAKDWKASDIQTYNSPNQPNKIVATIYR